MPTKKKPVKTKRTKVDICISYSDRGYIEGETEDGILFNIDEGLKKNKWRTIPDLDDAVDYQTKSTAVQFTLVTPATVTKKKIKQELGLSDLSVNFE